METLLRVPLIPDSSCKEHYILIQNSSQVNEDGSVNGPKIEYISSRDDKGLSEEVSMYFRDGRKKSKSFENQGATNNGSLEKILNAKLQEIGFDIRTDMELFMEIQLRIFGTNLDRQFKAD